MPARQADLIFDKSPTEIYLIDATTFRFLEANNRALKNLGYSLAELRAMGPMDLKPSDDQRTISPIIKSLLAGERDSATLYSTHRRKDGTTYPVEVHTQYLPGEKPILLSLALDITKRKEDEAVLRATTDVINASPATVFVWQNTEGWPVSYVSENVVRIFGYTDDDFVSGRASYAEMIHPDDLTRVADEVARASQDPQVTEFVHQPYRVHARDGAIMWVDDRTCICRDDKGLVTQYRGVVLDISEQVQAAEEKKILENRLYRADKMASIGQLAAGVAHEINNPISFIMSNLNTIGEYVGEIRELLAATAGTQSNTIADVTDILDDLGAAASQSAEGARRIRNIVLDMSTIARPGTTPIASADLNEGLKSTLNIMDYKFKELCRIELDLGDLPLLTCNASRLNQVFLNLLVNAGQALKDQADGVIRIHSWAAAEAIHVVFGDNGPGIPEEMLTQIFDAFFTTKEIGEGTGLGLSLAHEIVAEHGGHITVRSEIGAGTEFEVVLPLAGQLCTV